MKDLFGNISTNRKNFTIFQDEAGCENSNFFYHGFLFVDNEHGRGILDQVIKAKTDKSKNSEITFKEIKKDDYRVPIATRWLQYADQWLQEGKVRFFVLGVNKNNLKNFWDNSWSFEKNLYLRFFEIGLNSSMAWFKNDSNLDKPLQITHIYYEYGNYNDERRNKIKWLESLSGYKNAEPVYSDPKKQKSEKEELYEMSQLIQFTDILLGVTKYSFISLNPNHVGKHKCVNQFIEIVERFNNKSKAYRTNSSYYKRYALQFFPTKTDIKKDEFLSNDIENIIKRGSFYCDRPTYKQKKAQEVQIKLF